MPKVKVWNDNSHPYKEEFKGEKIDIAPHKSIWMEMDDAVLFKGTMPPLIRDGDGRQHPSSYKMIRIEEVPGEAYQAPIDDLKCLGCSYKATSKSDLSEHEKAAHGEQVVTDEEAEAELVQRKRGRPAKAASA